MDSKKRGYYDGCNEGRKLSAQALKLWQKLQPDLWEKPSSNDSHITSKRIKGANTLNNASGSTQKAG